MNLTLSTYDIEKIIHDHFEKKDDLKSIFPNGYGIGFSIEHGAFQGAFIVAKKTIPEGNYKIIEKKPHA
jgi:hypothetical protein